MISDDCITLPSNVAHDSPAIAQENVELMYVSIVKDIAIGYPKISKMCKRKCVN